MGWRSHFRTLLSSRPAAVKLMVLALACATSWLLYLHRYTWGILTGPIQREAARRGDPLGPVELGWLDSAFYVAYGIGQIPGGWAADRFGPRLALSLSVAIWSAVLGVMALASGFWPLLWLRALFGLAQAAAFPCLSQVTRSWFPMSVRTVVQGLVASMSARAGGACSSLILATLLLGIAGMEWRAALATLAGGGLLLALVFFLAFRNHPHEHPWLRAQELPPDQGPGSTASPAHRFSWDAGNVVNLSFFLTHAFASAFADNLFVTWIFRFLVDSKGLSPVTMGIYGSLPLWGGALGGVCGGILNDLLIRRSGRRRLSRSAVALVGKGMAAGLITAGIFLSDPFAAMLALACCKFFSDWSQASLWGTVTDIAGPASGKVFGIVNTAGNLGAFAAGPLMGYIMLTYGWDALFAAVAVVYAIASLSWLIIDCTRSLVSVHSAT